MRCIKCCCPDGPGGGILTTTFVDMHDFEQTSAFGRGLAAGGLASGAVWVPRYRGTFGRDADHGSPSGEFMLTRETARLLADTYDAHSVLIGSYSE